VIEGLRLLPFVADVPILNCEICLHGDKKQRLMPQTDEIRLRQACGRLPRRANARPFGVPAGVSFEPTVCPGFSTSLPEVAEAVRYRPSWLKGYLSEHLGAPPSPQMLDAQNVLEGAVNEFQQAEIERRAEEAKRHGGQ